MHLLSRARALEINISKGRNSGRRGGSGNRFPMEYANQACAQRIRKIRFLSRFNTGAYSCIPGTESIAEKLFYLFHLPWKGFRMTTDDASALVTGSIISIVSTQATLTINYAAILSGCDTMRHVLILPASCLFQIGDRSLLAIRH